MNRNPLFPLLLLLAFLSLLCCLPGWSASPAESDRHVDQALRKRPLGVIDPTTWRSALDVFQKSDVVSSGTFTAHTGASAGIHGAAPDTRFLTASETILDAQIPAGVARYSTNAFVPQLSGSAAGSTETYTSRIGQYTKIGNVCWYNLRIDLLSMGDISGNMLIMGLPFTASTTANMFPSGVVGFQNNITLEAGFTSLTVRVVPNTSYMYIYENGAAVDSKALPHTCCASDTLISVSGWYFTQ